MSAPKSLLILLLLVACGSEETSGGAGPAAPATAGLDAEPAVQTAAQLEERARAAIAVEALDSASARFASLRAGSGGSICGDIDAKGPDGKHAGFRPFAISPEGVAVISSAARIMFENPADMFPDFYIRYCASPEELPMLQRQMAAQLGKAAPADPLPVPEPVPPGEPSAGDPVLTPPPPPPPTRPTAPRQPRAAPTGDEDSFFNAVIRPDEERE